MNAADTNGWGEPRENRTAQILREFLVRLATANGGGANGFGVPLAGRIDFARLGLVGHSQRGARAVEIARARATSPGPVAAGRGRIRALLLLAPVLRPGSVPSGTAFGLVLPQCDNDVVDLGGLAYFDRADASGERPAALVYPRGANHNFFNSTLADEGGGSRRECRPRSKRLTRAAQTAWLARYAPVFFRAALTGGPALRAANLDPVVPPRRLVLRPASADVHSRPANESPRAPHRDRVGGRDCRDLPQGAFMRARALAADVPEAVVGGMEPPRGDGHQQPRCSAGRPRIRCGAAAGAVDPTDHSNPRWRPQAFSLVLRDAGGRSAAARVRRAAPALGFPPGRFGPGTKELSYVITSDLRVPLGAFRGVNLRRLVSTSLRFDRTRRGSILLANLELVRASQLR